MAITKKGGYAPPKPASNPIPPSQRHDVVITVPIVSAASTTTFSVPPSKAEVAREIMLALLDARDSLGWQLSHANGGMSDAQLDEIIEPYLQRKDWNLPALREHIQVLRSLIGDERVDIETVSVMFRCDLETARKALHEGEPHG